MIAPALPDLADELGVGHVEEYACHRLKPEILVNATPLGRDGESWPDRLPLPTTLVLDAPYAMGPTDLTERSLEAGIVVVTGRDLLLEQALGQFRRMTGRTAPRELLAEALERRFPGPVA